jgi:RNA polymerase sigma factor (sigma-70 family)
LLFKKISDKVLLEGILNQDDKILNWLYDNYYQDVKNHVLRNSGNKDDASDVFQDTIIILYKQVKENSLELTSDLKGYFFGIARNVWSSVLRKNKTTEDISPEINVAEDDPDSNELMFERVVSKAFEKLSPENQVILNLFTEGISYEEIALKMDLKNDTYARRKKYLAKEALMDLVREDPEYQEYLRLQR